MTDLSVTAANVVPGSDAKIIRGLAGETITAGQPVYRDATTRKFMKADSDSATQAVREPAGIALHGASDGQPLAVQTEGLITIGATLTVGEIYVLSDTPGGIMPEGDLEAGDYPVVIGVARTAAILNMGRGFIIGGAAVPA